MIGKLFWKLEQIFALPGIIREFGVVGYIQQGYYQCEVKAFLRNLQGLTFLTFRIKKKIRGMGSIIFYLDLDVEGIKNFKSLKGGIQWGGCGTFPNNS
ncbi:MAG: hypothetical protein EHM45_18830 [Desulfobacteraceae bacterium]|nr:MAG: hypothetical protein EHM45_18830 [Desulfobacteraceae bacterium]